MVEWSCDNDVGSLFLSEAMQLESVTRRNGDCRGVSSENWILGRSDAL